jgi:hypothetical protein
MARFFSLVICVSILSVFLLLLFGHGSIDDGLNRVCGACLKPTNTVSP